MSVTAAPTAHPVAARLRASGIDEIVVIDDAFDIPDVEHVGDLDAFWAAVVDDEPAKAELSAIKDVSGVDDINDDLIAKLWALRGSHLAELAAIHLFASQLEQQKDVIALCSNLEAIGF